MDFSAGTVFEEGAVWQQWQKPGQGLPPLGIHDCTNHRFLRLKQNANSAKHVPAMLTL